jgi:TetR/AcrR family transcriptional repressor of mexJK operon
MTTGTSKKSAPPPRRGRPRDPERMRRVLEAARQHFFEHGYEGANLDAIAEAAGVSKMTVYSYFPSKEALFENVVGSRTDRVAGSSLGSGVFDPRQPETVLTSIGAHFQDLIREKPVLGQFRALYGAAATQGEACRVFFKQGPDRLGNDVAAYLRTAHEAGTLHVPQPRLAADLFLSMFLGSTHIHALLGLGLPSRATEKDVLREAVRIFMAAHGPVDCAR